MGKNKKPVGVEMPMMTPSVSLEGEHAKPFIKHKVGDKVKFTVHGTKKRHSSYDSGKGMTHSIGIDIHKIAMDGTRAHEDAESSDEEMKEHKTGAEKPSK